MLFYEEVGQQEVPGWGKKNNTTLLACVVMINSLNYSFLSMIAKLSNIDTKFPNAFQNMRYLGNSKSLVLRSTEICLKSTEFSLKGESG